jgi:Flp pilus assembly pilin Flp
MRKLLARLWKEQKGQDLVEYALVLLMIALMIIASTTKLSQTIQNAYAGIANTVSAASTPANSGGQGSGGPGGGGNGGGN